MQDKFLLYPRQPAAGRHLLRPLRACGHERNAVTPYLSTVPAHGL